MKFFHTLVGSLTRRDFYKHILSGTEKTGFFYIFKLQVLSALFLTILLSIGISGILPSIEKTAKEILPPGAEIIIKNGELKTNTNPIIVPIPSSIDDGSSDRSLPTNAIVLDITASTTVADLEKKDTFVLVTAEGIITQNPNGKVTMSFFKNIQDADLVIDENWLAQKSAWLKNFAKYIPFIAFFLILGGLYLLSLFTALIYGLFVYLMLKIVKTPKSFRIAYSVGLYSRTFAVLLALFAFVLPIFAVSPFNIVLQLLFLLLMLRQRNGARTVL